MCLRSSGKVVVVVDDQRYLRISANASFCSSAMMKTAGSRTGRRVPHGRTEIGTCIGVTGVQTAVALCVSVLSISDGTNCA